ncbi:MAG TPA: autotransporter domain-containing protein [Terriglobia bacterium]|nr:autotransporter domain-containing protein [Terriglobia bacterium]
MHLHLSLAGARAGTTKRGFGYGFARSLATSVSLLALGLALSPTAGRAADIDWNGSVSTDYNTAGNWNGGTVPTTTDNINIGVAPGNSQPVISGTNVAVGTVNIGNAGDGSMVISNGGTLTSNSGTIGYDVNSTGAVTVTGAGSNWTLNGTFGIGALSGGQLTISNGGSVLATGNIALGMRPGITGTINVDGTGSSLTDNMTIRLGILNGGIGKLNISNGATVSSNGAFIGDIAGATGTANVIGGTWQSANSLFYVGLDGSGSLDIAQGGSVVIANGTGLLRLADNAGSFGVLAIGSSSGVPATAAGTLDAASVVIGAGDGTIVFNHTSTNYSFAPDISGNGTISQLAGTTYLLGDDSGYTGTVYVSGGRLVVNTSLGGGNAIVSQDGILDGAGTLGSFIASSGGTVSPGDSIGSIRITGNATFNPGSVYQVEVNSAGQGDVIKATGTATLNGGDVQVVAANGSYAANTTYTILNATGGVTGTFSGVTANYAFLTPTLSYDPNNVYLNLASNGASFASVAETPNQQAVADAVDSMGSGDVYASIQSMDAASARAAYDKLSGEVHASAAGALMNNAHYLNDAVFGRLRGTDLDADNPDARQLAAADGLQIETAAGPTTSRALWAQAFGSWAENDGDGNAAKIDNTTAGFLVGLDGEVAPGWRLGLASGYSHSDIDAAARQSQAGVDSFHIAAYGGGHVGPVSLRLGAAYSFNAVDSSRDVDLGRVSDHDKASYNAHTAQVFGEIGYDAKIGKVALEPFAGMSYVNLSTDGFTEHGGAAALKSHGSNQDLPASTLGLRAGGEIAQIGTAKLSANGMLGWRHAFGDVTPEASFNFASGSDGFTVSGTPIARNALVAEAGLDLAVDNRLAIGLSYDGQVASDARDHAVQGKLSWKF